MGNQDLGDADGFFRNAMLATNYGGADLGRLLADGGEHLGGRIRFVADEFDGGGDECEAVVNVVAEGGKLLVEFSDLPLLGG